MPEVDFNYTHPVGCLVWYSILEVSRKELDPKANPSMFLSYVSDGKGYRLWDLQNITVVESRDVMFDETTFPYISCLISAPEPIMCELPWPFRHPSPFLKLPHRTLTLDLPFPNVQRKPRGDQRLQVSINVPDREGSQAPPPPPISPPPPLPPLSPLDPKLPRSSARQARKPDFYSTCAKAALVEKKDKETPKTSS